MLGEGGVAGFDTVLRTPWLLMEGHLISTKYLPSFVFLRYHEQALLCSEALATSMISQDARVAASAGALSAIGGSRSASGAYLQEVYEVVRFTFPDQWDEVLLSTELLQTHSHQSVTDELIIITGCESKRKTKRAPLSADLHFLGQGSRGRMDGLGIWCRPYLSAGCARVSRLLLQHNFWRLDLALGRHDD